MKVNHSQSSPMKVKEGARFFPSGPVLITPDGSGRFIKVWSFDWKWIFSGVFNMDVVYILWLRQLKRYVRSKPRVLASLGQPLLFLLGLGYGFGPIFQKAGEGKYIQFLAPGVVAMAVLFTSVFSGIELIWDRQFGFLKETLVAPAPRFAIMLGRTLGGATTALAQGLIVVLICVLAGFRFNTVASLPTALLFMAGIAILFTALGTAIASLMNDFQGFQLVMNFLVMPVFFLSGALFPLKNVPGTLAFLARMDPLSYGVDGLRGALLGSSYFGMTMDFGVLFVLAAGFLALGSCLFSRIQI
jgi:ABC-2 type transport system permease protein